jgi:hypothetical protein
MVGRIALIRVTSVLLLASGPALCQSERPSANLIQGLEFEGSRSTAISEPGSLPDAPSVQRPTGSDKFYAFVEEAGSPLTFGAVTINAAVMRDEAEHFSPGRQPSFTSLYRAAMLQKESSAFLGKYLYPMLLRQDPRYHPSTSDSIVGRTTYAASRVLITRNDAGKRTLNTSYLLGVLTSAVVATAYRPYWARSASTTFKDLGSTIGSDAGMNVFHEFWPGIRQVVNRHSPKFVSRIADRISPNQTPRQAPSTPIK